MAQPHQDLYIFLKDDNVESGCLTYATLDRKARAIAAYLQTQSVQPGQRVLLSYPLTEGLAFIAAFFGCLYAGAVVVTAWPPMNQSLSSELQYKAADAAVSLGLTAQTLLAQIQTTFGQNPELAHIPWLATEPFSLDLAEDWQAPELASHTLAYLQYTAGSTGIPKGAMISHKNLLHNSAVIAHCFGATRDDRGVIWLPLYHDMGLIGGILQPLYASFPVCLMSPLSFMRRPLRWLQAISHYRATISGGPNFAYELCIDKIKSADLKRLDLSTWTIAFNGAEPVQARTLERFAAAFAPYQFRPEAFCPCYGMAETTVMAASNLKLQTPQVLYLDPDALAQNQVRQIKEEQVAGLRVENRSAVSCGQAVLGQQIRIVDPETCQPCSVDQVGEIWIAGDSVAQGYWNNAEATAATFQGCLANTGEGTFLRTGDIGFLASEQLYITGRLKEVIIIWGRNLYPQHLEQAIAQSHPAFAFSQGAAFSLEQDGQEQLVIVQEISRRSQHSAPLTDLVAIIQTTISQQFLVEPQQIALVKSGSIPKTPTGKVQRIHCRQQWRNGQLPVIHTWRQTISGGNIDWEAALA